MPSFVTGALTRRVVHDAPTGLTTLVDLFTSVQVDPLALPIASSELFRVYSIWERHDGEDIEVRSTPLAPDLARIEGAQIAAVLDGRKRLHSWEIELPTLNLIELGWWYITLELKRDGRWLEVARLPFLLEARP